CAKLGTYFDYW
nr:immunoglobulin heavy chain junction region [Mus musculus]MBK4195842.1 immunoglobulin heavy chain junction region [Mus musculus]MBK4195845.1 immunoglobulin heavy chain junction region [Mus musculus]MBK4195846.1 immunoglobulin heavy chain junction region [Mus musculus]MBK4195847.1 immunoglobulin heavy chain junction region [Mus musculus]